MPDKKQLLKDFYAKYAPDVELTEERYGAIEKKYGDNTESLLKDFYAKYAPDVEFSSERYEAIQKKYGLKKGGLTSMFDNFFKEEPPKSGDVVKKKEPTTLDSGSSVGSSPSPPQYPKGYKPFEPFAETKTAADIERERIGLTPNNQNSNESTSFTTPQNKQGAAVPNAAVPIEKNIEIVKDNIEKKVLLDDEVAFNKVSDKASLEKKTTSEYFDQNSDVFVDYLADDEQMLEYDLLKNENTLKNEVDRLSKLPVEKNDTPGYVNELTRKKFELYKVQQDREKIVSDRNSRVSFELKVLDDELTKAKVANNADEVDRINKEIQKKKSERDGYFKDPNAKILQIFTENKEEMDKFKVPGTTPLERTKNYALLLKQQILDIDEKIAKRIKDGESPLSLSAIGGGSSNVEILYNKKAEIEKRLKQVAPIALLNQMPKTKEEGFFGSAFNAIANELLPQNSKNAIGLTTNNEIGDLLTANRVAMGLSNDVINESIVGTTDQLSAPTEAFTKEWFGGMLGTSLSMMPAFALGNKVAGVAKVPLMIEKVGLALNGMKYGKYLAKALPSIEKGIEYRAAKPFLSDDLAEEATFLSGFLGQAISGTMMKGISSANMQSMLSNMFGESAPAVVNILRKTGNKIAEGLGETGEEYGNTLGPILDLYITGKDFNNLKNDLKENFGTLDKNLELFVGSFVMGMAMGSGTGLGAASLNKSKETYAAMTPEQKKKADAIVKAFNDDVKKAEVEVKKEEIKKGDVKEVVAVTDVELDELELAKQSISDPNSSRGDKREAAKKIVEIEEKKREEEITKLALEEEDVKVGDMGVEVEVPEVKPATIEVKETPIETTPTEVIPTKEIVLESDLSNEEGTGLKLSDTPSLKSVKITDIDDANLSISIQAKVIDAIDENNANNSWDKALRGDVENLGFGWFRVGKTIGGESILHSPKTNKTIVLESSKGGVDGIAVQDFLKNNATTEQAPPLVDNTKTDIDGVVSTDVESVAEVGGDKGALGDVESTAKALEAKDAMTANIPFKGLSVRMSDLRIAEDNLAKGKKSVTPNDPVEVTINLTNGEQELSDGYHRYLDARGGNIEKAKTTNVDGNINAKIKFEVNEKSNGFTVQREATNKEISEAYHKAKADGSNPELVEAVESLLKEQPQAEQEKVKKINKKNESEKNNQNVAKEQITNGNPIKSDRKISQKAKGLGRGRTPKYRRKIKNPRYLQALKKESAGDPYLYVLQYFIGGGTYDANLLRGIYGEANRTLPKGELRSRIAFLEKGGYQSSELLGERLSEGYMGENYGMSESESNDSQAFRNIVEDIVASFSGRSEMVDAVLEMDDEMEAYYQGEYDNLSDEYGDFADMSIDILSEMSDESIQKLLDEEQEFYNSDEYINAEKGGDVDIPKKSDTEREAELKEIIDQEIRASRNDLGVFKAGSGRLWTAMGKLIGLYVKKGITKFSDFIKATGYKSSEIMKDLWDIRNRKNTPIGKSGKMPKLRTLNARLHYAEALLDIDPTASAQVQLDALKDTIMAFEVMSIHANKHEINDIMEAKQLLKDLYVELSSDLPLISQRLAEEIANGRPSLELKKDLDYKDALLEWIQDDFVAQKNVQKEIAKKRGVIADESNPYMQKDISQGRAQDIVDRVDKFLFGNSFGKLQTNDRKNKSFVSRMKDAGIRIGDLELYQYAKHASEYNARVRAIKDFERNEEITEKKEKIADYQTQAQTPSTKGQITRLQNEIIALQNQEIPQSGSGMTDVDAQEILNRFDAEGKTDNLEAFRKEFKEEVSDKAIDMLEESGVLTNEQAQMLRDGTDEKTGIKFDYYVPLKVNQGMFGDKNGSGSSGSSMPVKRIKGTDTYDFAKRNSPFTQSLLDFRAAAKASEQNKVNESLYNLVKENPQKDLWEVIGDNEFVPQSVRDNAIPVKVGGTKKLIVINNPSLRDAWKRQPTKFGRITKAIVAVFRTAVNIKRALLTTYSLEFGLVNPFRDMQDALFNATGLNIPGLKTKIIKNYKSSLQASFKAIYGNLDPNSEMGKVVDSYLKSGGKISWMDYATIETESKKIEGLEKQGASPMAITKKSIEVALSTISGFNDAMETGTRLAIYKSLIDSGVSESQAAMQSKNLTVNFNKKGTATPMVNLFWMFSNAGVQGVKSGLTSFKNSRNSKLMAGGLFLAGFSLPFIRDYMIEMFVGDDEDEKEEYRKLLSEQDTKGGVVLPTGNGRFVNLPYGYGLPKFMINSGQSLAGLVQNGSAGEFAADLGATALGYIDVVGGQKENKTTAYLPTMLQMPFELMMNRNARNQTIYPIYKRVGHYHQFYKPKTDQSYINLAKSLHETIGLDISPNTLEYLVKDYSGGLPKTIMNTKEILSSALRGEAIDQNKIPFYRRFVVNMDQQEWRQQRAFYEIDKLSTNAILKKGEIEFAKKIGEKANIPELDKRIDEMKINQLDVKIVKELGYNYKAEAYTPEEVAKISNEMQKFGPSLKLEDLDKEIQDMKDKQLELNIKQKLKVDYDKVPLTQEQKVEVIKIINSFKNRKKGESIIKKIKKVGGIKEIEVVKEAKPIRIKEYKPFEIDDIIE